MRIIRAPEPLTLEPNEKSVFLAGTIAGDWRDAVCEALRDVPVAILDPRRSDWGAGWSESAEDPAFRAQTEWELLAQERASLVAMYLAADSEASVSLLELGLAVRGGNLVVCCQEGFWCKPLVDVACRRYGVTTVPDLAALIDAVRTAVR